MLLDTADTVLEVELDLVPAEPLEIVVDYADYRLVPTATGKVKFFTPGNVPFRSAMSSGPETLVGARTTGQDGRELFELHLVALQAYGIKFWLNDDGTRYPLKSFRLEKGHNLEYKKSDNKSTWKVFDACFNILVSEEVCTAVSSPPPPPGPPPPPVSAGTPRCGGTTIADWPIGATRGGICWEVTFSGITNNACSLCSYFNQSFHLSQSSLPCVWQNIFPLDGTNCSISGSYGMELANNSGVGASYPPGNAQIPGPPYGTRTGTQGPWNLVIGGSQCRPDPLGLFGTWCSTQVCYTLNNDEWNENGPNTMRLFAIDSASTPPPGMDCVGWPLTVTLTKVPCQTIPGDAPEITAPATFGGALGEYIEFTGADLISIDDPDDTTVNVMLYFFHLADGILHLETTTGLTFNPSLPNNSRTVGFEASITDANAALATLIAQVRDSSDAGYWSIYDAYAPGLVITVIDSDFHMVRHSIRWAGA